MKPQDKNKKFIRLNVIEDGQTVTKLDVPHNFLKRLDLKEKITLAEFNKLLWRNLYYIPNKDSEELLEQKGLI